MAKFLLLIKNIWLWFLSIFMAFASILFFPSISSIYALLFVLLTIPIKRIRTFIFKKGIRGGFKIFLLCALFVLCFSSAPSNASETEEAPASTVPLVSVAETASPSEVVSSPVPSTSASESMAGFLLVLFTLVAFFFFKKFPKKKTQRCKNTSTLPCKSYVVIDIETTGLSRKNDRIIEIAANLYKDGSLSDQFHTYVNPGFHIPNSITQLTGIRDSDVENSPSVQNVKKSFLQFIRNYPLVGHNIAAFDIPFLCEQFGVKISNTKYDTLALSKKAFPGLLSYKLSYLAQALHLSDLKHHRASNDILVNNELFLACYNPSSFMEYLSDDASISKIPLDEKRQLFSRVDIHSITPTDVNAIQNTALSGKLVCFTGELSIPRQQACQMAVDAGAILKSSVSKKLDFLVVGVQDRRLVGETGMSNAQLYADTLLKQGHSKLKVINESEFIELLKPIP